MDQSQKKSLLRAQLRQALAAITPQQRAEKSQAACSLVTAAPEFIGAQVVMLYLSTPEEVDTASLALRAWQMGKTVVVPKVLWSDRHMMPIEISSLTTGLKTSGKGIREPDGGKPVPLDMIQLIIVPGMGFSPTGYRIGRGMGFYDRFLAQHGFSGMSCGLCFEEQVISNIPVLDHDVPLGMLVSDRQVRRFADKLIQR